MEESKWKGMTLEFREESVSNVIYEDSAAFGRSVSNEAYRKAFQITQTILSINDRYQDKGKKGGTAIRSFSISLLLSEAEARERHLPCCLIWSS